MGHVGLTPQTSTALGGYKAQGRSAAAADTDRARGARAAGGRLLLDRLRGDPVGRRDRADAAACTIPVIGIGAGPAVDGQVLVFHDLLGIREGLGARFVKRYANLLDEMVAGVAAFADEVRDRTYPGPEHGYSIDAVRAGRLPRDARRARSGDRASRLSGPAGPTPVTVR